MLTIEFCLVVAALAGAFIFPNLGSRWFVLCERAFGKLARKRGLTVLVVGLTALAARAALLPIEPIPTPLAGDEFSYLLGADTFAHGRLTNPPHPMRVHFEGLNAIEWPTYASVHPPGQALFLAAGQVIAGHPFWGVWLSVGVMCAAICWMLQGWMEPGWALLGGFLAIIRLGTFSYWANSYWGGAVAAIGGALVLGALPRMRHSQRVRDALLMGLGLAILANTRSYEGLFFSLPVAGALLAWTVGKNRLPLLVMIRRVVSPLVLVLVVVALQTGYYNWRVTGSAFVLPHDLISASCMVPNFLWQPLRPVTFQHKFLYDYFVEWELPQYVAVRTLAGFLLNTLEKLLKLWFFYLWPLLSLPPLLAVVTLPYGFSWRDISRPTRFLLIAGGVAFAGLALEVFLSPHYAAPMTCLILALVLIAMRRLRAWQSHGRPVGLFLTRAIPVIALVMLVLRVGAGPLRLPLPDPTSLMWCSPREPDFGRVAILNQLDALPGRHLVLVRYGPAHNVFIDWVHNDADVDGSKVIWARDMGRAGNEELIEYFRGRQVWLLEADETPPRLLLYSEGKAALTDSVAR